EAAEPGALPSPVPAAPRAPGAPPSPAPVAPPAVPAPRADTVRVDTIGAVPRAEGPPVVRRFGVAPFEERILERLERTRPDRRPLTGVARVRVTDLAVEEPGGPRFAEVESAEFGLDLGALLAGDVILSDVVLEEPDVIVRRGPGQDWNYQRAWRAIVGAAAPAADGDPSATATVALTDVRVVGGRLVVESPTTSVAVLGLDADIARATLSDPAAPAPEIVARRASGEVVLAEIGRRFDVVAVNAAALLNDGTS